MSKQATITALVIQKNNKERVKVYLDGEFAFGLSLNLALDLKKGQQLAEADIARLKFDDAVETAYQRALRYLGYRPRARQEIERYLHDQRNAEEVIARVVERLADQQYLDDAAFGRLWVESRSRSNPKGRRALRYELRQKGLHEAEIEQVLAGLDEEALAWQAVQRRLNQWRGLDARTFRRKLAGYLGYRGFNYDTIETIFAKAWAGRAED